jgi:hypothetical protein
MLAARCLKGSPAPRAHRGMTAGTIRALAPAPEIPAAACRPAAGPVNVSRPWKGAGPFPLRARRGRPLRAAGPRRLPALSSAACGPHAPAGRLP